MPYATPLQDFRFALKELAGLEEVLKLPGFEEVTPDLVDAILEENGRFVEQAVAPLNVPGDTQPPVWKDGHVATTPGYAQGFKDYAAGGWQGLQHPAAWGGQGLPKLVAAAPGENIQAASLAFSLCPMLTDGVIEAILTVGSDAQRKQYVPNLIGGKWTGTMNLTEPQAGSDLAQVATRAVKQEDGSYRLTGQKIFITYGEHDLAENIIHLVLARTPDAPAGVKGISLFIVPKFLVQADGSPGRRNDVWCASLEHKLGIHGSPTAVLLYGSGKGEVGEGAIGYLVGEQNRGLEYMFIMMNAARYSVGQQGIGVSERAYQHALAYARERVQGRAVEGSAGPVAIVRHPDVQRMLMTMKALTEAARAVSYVAAAAHDKGTHHPDPEQRARNRAFYEYLVPIVKGFSTENAVEVASLASRYTAAWGSSKRPARRSTTATRASCPSTKAPPPSRPTTWSAARRSATAEPPRMPPSRPCAKRCARSRPRRPPPPRTSATDCACCATTWTAPSRRTRRAWRSSWSNRRPTSGRPIPAACPT